MIRSFLVMGICISYLMGCSPRATTLRLLQETENKFQDHTGFYLYDPSSKKVLIDFNGDRYFTPASNTKIFTFYTALKLLGDSVTGFHYEQRNDSLIIWGSGDPSFLYPYVHQNEKVYQFLQNPDVKLFVSHPSTHTLVKPLGPGWAWSDYTYSYSAERSALPVYGNLIRAQSNGDNTVHTRPAIFMEHIAYSGQVKKSASLIREVDSNMLTFFPGEKKQIEKWEVPFRSSSDLIVELLSDTLKKPVEEINLLRPKNVRHFKSIPTDSLYKVMMEDSDNFIAEQLLLLCAGAISDTLDSDIAIRYAKKNLLSDLPDNPVWVDGSGLSRYNLFTPRSIVRLWEKINEEVPSGRLLQLLATGGKSGTIRNWYKAEQPFVFAKTGSLSNNHSLSGFLITRKGKKLLFSFMSSHFITSSTEVRKEMEKILFTIRDRY